MEGESDCHTLWFKGIPAIGLPGSTTWNEKRDAHYFKEIKTIYAAIEPDEGGEKLLSSLKASSLAPQVKIIFFNQKYKDPSAMYLASSRKFRKRFKKAKESAIPLPKLVSDISKQVRRENWKICQRIAKRKNILAHFSNALTGNYVAGERSLAKVLFLAMITRLFRRPVPILIKSDSSAGKSFLLEVVLRFFPGTAYYILTSSSKKALYFADESFTNRFFIFYEAAGINNPDLDHTVRILLSEGKLRYLVTESNTDGQFTARHIEKEGPTGLITTTVKKHLNPENETRYLAFSSDETIRQSGKIVDIRCEEAACDQKQESVDFSEWHAFQGWLESGEPRVIIGARSAAGAEVRVSIS